MSLAWTAEAIAEEFVTLMHCPTAEQKGDLFTKALDRIKHREALDAIGMKQALIAALGCFKNGTFSKSNRQNPYVLALLASIADEQENSLVMSPKSDCGKRIDDIIDQWIKDF